MVRAGARAGVRAGINPSLGGLTSIPATSGDWAAFSGVDPTSAWTCQGTSFTDMFGANAFTTNGTPDFEQTGLDGRDAILCSGAEGFIAPNSTLMDGDGSTDLTIFMHINIDTGLTGTERGIFGKRTGGLAGYSCGVRVTGGNIRMVFDDGTDQGNADATGNHINGWHTVCFRLDRTADEAEIRTTLGTTLRDLSTGPTIDSMSTAENLAFGASNGNNAQLLLLSYVAIWDGTAITDAQVTELEALF